MTNVDIEEEKKLTEQLRVLLIIGSPRSGTTLLSAMLSCHPDISILNEDRSGAVFRILSKRVKGIKLCIPNQIKIENTHYTRIKDFIITYFYIFLNYVRIKFGGEWKGIPSEIKSKYSIRDYEKHAKNLFVLAIIRDLDSVVKSIMKRGGQSKKIAEYRWRRSIEIIYQLSKERPDDEGLTIVHFDNLVKEPKLTMQKILTRIDCDYDDCVLEGYKHTPQYRGRSRIDDEKASIDPETALDYYLLRNDNELREKYLYLIDKTRMISCV